MAFTEARWLLLRLWQLETPRLSSCGAMAATEALATGDTSAEYVLRTRSRSNGHDLVQTF